MEYWVSKTSFYATRSLVVFDMAETNKASGDLDLVERIALFMFDQQPVFSAGENGRLPLFKVGFMADRITNYLHFYPMERGDVITGLSLRHPFYNIVSHKDFLTCEIPASRGGVFSLIYIFKTREAFDKAYPKA